MRDKRKAIFSAQVGFVLLLLAVLTLPIYLGRRNDQSPASGSSPTFGESVEPSGPGATGEADEEEPDEPVEVVAYPSRVRLAGKYPQRCLNAVERPSPGFIAAFAGGRVKVAAPGADGASTSFKASPPIQFAPSGRTLLTGRGRAFGIAGGGSFDAWDGEVDHWAWSPVADCPLGVDEGTVVLGRPAVDEPRPLLEALGEVSDLHFSPDGRRLALVAQAEGRLHLWIVHLDRGVALRARSFPRGAVRPIGWSGNERLYFGQAQGASIAADGVFLQSIRREPSDKKAVRRHFRFTTLGGGYVRCADRDLIVVGGGRELTSNKRLATVPSSGRTPNYLTPEGFAYSSPSCSPDGQYIVAARVEDGGDASARRLVLLQSDGTLIRVVTPPGADQPTWGPEGTGVVYVQDGGGASWIYYAPVGGNAERTPLKVRSSVDAYGARTAGTWDWSADQPSGAPPR